MFPPKSRFDNFLYKQIFFHNFRKNFSAISVKNFENVSEIIKQSREINIPVIFCSNHSNWWDASLAIYLSLEIFKIDAYYFISEERKLNKNFEKLGVINYKEHNLENDTKEIFNFVKGSSKFIWIFPQTDITDNHSEIKFLPVISDLVDSLKEVVLVNCMIDYQYINDKRPEIFIDFFETKNFTGISYLNKESFNTNLEQKFEFKLKEIKQKIAHRDFYGFKKILEGKK